MGFRLHHLAGEVIPVCTAFSPLPLWERRGDANATFIIDFNLMRKEAYWHEHIFLRFTF